MNAHTPNKPFAVGQIWEARDGEQLRIEAITDHPETPIIARSRSGLVDCFGRNGAWESDGAHREIGEISNGDLVTLIEVMPPAATVEWDTDPEAGQ